MKLGCICNNLALFERSLTVERRGLVVGRSSVDRRSVVDRSSVSCWSVVAWSLVVSLFGRCSIVGRSLVVMLYESPRRWPGWRSTAGCKYGVGVKLISCLAKNDKFAKNFKILIFLETQTFILNFLKMIWRLNRIYWMPCSKSRRYWL